MFEYLNTGAFGLLVVFSLLLMPIRKGASFLFIILGFLFLLVFYDAYSSYRDVKSNIKYFKDGNTLVCFSGGGVYTSADKYSVSKSNGWSLKKDHFIKDSLMIRADLCEEY